MAHRNLCLTTVLLFALLISAAKAQESSISDEPAQTAIPQLEQRWADAITQADIPAIDTILADDFRRPAPQSGQFIGKRELLDFYRSHLSPHSTTELHIESMTVTVYGDTALARGIVVSTKPANPPVRSLFTDVFVKRENRWLAVSAQENPIPR